MHDSVDELLAMNEDTTPPKSCFWGHSWTRWVVSPGKISGRNATIQMRRCTNCNKAELETL